MTPVERWLSNNRLGSVDVDCAIAVMLKIIDGKCKMADDEKRIMTALYDAVKFRNHRLLNSSVHGLIATARESGDETLKLLVYEQRLLAETTISRPVMKSFKARIRQRGLLDCV